MKKRQPSRQGLSYLDANTGRLVTEGPDILNIKQEIESRWNGVLSVFFDVEAEEWVVVEHCKDGTDRMVMTTRKLDSRAIDKLNRIDQAKHPQGDLNHKYDVEDTLEEHRREHRITEAVGEAAERLFFALRKDGVIHAPKNLAMRVIK
jgi:hypothetical protein